MLTGVSHYVVRTEGETAAAAASTSSSEAAQGKADAATQTAAVSGGSAAANAGTGSTGVEALRMPRGFEALLRETIDPYPDFPIKGITFLVRAEASVLRTSGTPNGCERVRL